MPKYRLLSRTSSFFLIFFISARSFGSNKASSMAEAMWHPMPPLKSLIDASSLRGSPPCMGVGSQACGSRGWVSDLSRPRWDAWLTFCCFAAHWAFSSRVGRDLPVSTMSFPFCSFYLFKSAALVLTSWDWWGGWWGVGRGDLVGGGGIWDCADLLGAPFPSWFSISSIKLLWGFRWTPISSKFVLGVYSLIKNLEFVRGVCQIYNFLFFSSSVLLFFEDELGWGCFYWRSGNEKWLGARSAFGEWNTL